MPSGEPNPDAPEYYWAGQQDAQNLADSIGMSWTQPLWALNQTRVVNIAELCAAPAPSAPVFTTVDLVLGLNPFADNTPVREKLKDATDAYLWRTFCTAVDDPPPPPIPDNPPPADLPPNPPPDTDENTLHKQMFAWLQWMVRNIVTRNSHGGDPETVSGSGYLEFPGDEGGTWPVFAMGCIATLIEQPPNGGRTEGGDFPVWYDLGWFSLKTDDAGHQPIRLQHNVQIASGYISRVHGVYYNLPPGVVASFSPIYPQAGPGGGGG